MIQLRGRVALVSGGGRGIGRACAVALARAGADIAISYTNGDVAAESTVRDLRALGVKAAAIRADLTSFDEAERLIASATKVVGAPAILIANHGVWSPAPIDTVTEEQYDRELDTNLKGVFA